MKRPDTLQSMDVALGRIHSWLRRRWGRTHLPLWYDPAYRLPIAALESKLGLEPRRADLVAWYLGEHRPRLSPDLRRPRRASYEELGRVHTPAFLETLSQPATLARIYGVEPGDVPVDEVLQAVRLGCGGTLDAARVAVGERRATLNLLGGFHHAAPDRAGGLCPVNDIAVAVADLRAGGFRRSIAILDLDAHPPDGTARCFAGDDSIWLGSLSGSDWGPIEGADETLLPEGCGDEEYLAALARLLERMPPVGLAFVIAGGDVLAGDRLGRLGLTLGGARQRDQRVLLRLGDVPSVWLPGGGYHLDAWKILAGVGLLLGGRGDETIAEDADPLHAHFAWIAHTITDYGTDEGDGHGGDAPTAGKRRGPLLHARDLEEALGLSAREHRFLGHYTAETIEYRLYRYGFLEQLRRLGYGQFHVQIGRHDPGDRLRLSGHAEGETHLLVECILEERTVADAPMLFIHWLSLRHPRAQFSPARPRLPGQEVPGLGLSREWIEILGRMAWRLGLTGVAYRPSWYHTARPARSKCRFIDPSRQARFEALMRDLEDWPLLDVTQALSDGRVRMNGQPYNWEADDMAFWIDRCPLDLDRVRRERELLHFTVVGLPSSRTDSPAAPRSA